MIKINVPFCVAIAKRRLDGHPITISEQVAVCDLLLAYYKAQPSEERPSEDYVKRLERMALDEDGYRCEACRLVFDYDDVEFGEDCVLCKPCAGASRSEVPRAGLKEGGE